MKMMFHAFVSLQIFQSLDLEASILLHVIPFICVVSSTDAIIGGQAGRTSESTAFTCKSSAVCCLGQQGRLVC
jgi:hypothetical protein